MSFQPLELGANGEEVVLLQKALNEKLNMNMRPDGDFGVMTQNAIIEFQNNNGLETTGTYGEPEYEILGSFIDDKYIRRDDIEAISLENDFNPAFVKAVADVEGKSTGFLSDGRPLILFERHKFYADILKTQGREAAVEIQAEAPNICHPVWDKKAYIGYAGEYNRLEIAKKYSEESAYKAASWGMFQILGSNYRLCDVDNVFDFVAANETSEHLHFQFFISFIINQTSLLQAFRSENIEAFVGRYNGPGQVEFYSNRIRTALRRYS